MFISGATSQNASYADSISIQVFGEPQLFGSLGLTIPSGTQGVVSVQFQALATVAVTGEDGPSDGNIVITIVRGSQPTDPLVYSSVQSVHVPEGEQIIYQIAATAADYNVAVPPTRFLEYTAFLVSPDSTVVARRIGPECFEAFAFSTIS